MTFENFFTTFFSVVDNGSFRTAAEKLYISPASVINHINTLESEYNITLFKRTSHGVELTPSGKAFYKNAVEVKNIWNKGLQEVRLIGSEPGTMIRIGDSLMHPARAVAGVFTNMIGSGRKYIPQIVPFEDAEKNKFRLYENFGIDFDVLPSPYTFDSFEQNLKFQRLWNCRFCFGVPYMHRLSQKGFLTPDDLSGETIVIGKQGNAGALDRMRQKIHTLYPTVQIQDAGDFCDASVINSCLQNNYILLAIDQWKDSIPYFKFIPSDVDEVIPYGFIYSSNSEQKVIDFISDLKCSNFGFGDS